MISMSGKHLPGASLVGLAVALALVASACGGGSGDSGDTAATSAPTSGQPADNVELVVGVVLPETGALAYLYPAMGAGVDLALEDIQAARGNVKVLTGDTATDPDVAPETVSRLLGEGAHVILGAAASGVSQSFIQILSDAQVPQCGPSNTSASFSTQANADFYFRTSPSVVAEAPILANLMASAGATHVGVIVRADDYGASLAEQVEKRLADLGIAVDTLTYAPDAANHHDVVTAALATGSDTFLLISFVEGVQIIRGLLEEGVPTTAMFGGAGLFSPSLPELVDPAAPQSLDGFRVISPFGSEDFNQRLKAEHGRSEVAFGANAYDCLVVLALAAEAAGSVDGPDILAVVQEVTGNGVQCSNYLECSTLMAAGENIDYDGVSGPIDLDEVGDITVGTYAVMDVVGGETVLIDNRQVKIDTGQ